MVSRSCSVDLFESHVHVKLGFTGHSKHLFCLIFVPLREHFRTPETFTVGQILRDTRVSQK